MLYVSTAYAPPGESSIECVPSAPVTRAQAGAAAAVPNAQRNRFRCVGVGAAALTYA